MNNIKINKKVRYVLYFILCLVFISCFNETTSRYLGELTADDEVIAKPILSLDKVSTSTEITDMIPGDVREFEFQVTNQSGLNLNEVLLSYNLEVVLDSPIPLTIELYDAKGQKLELFNNETAEERIDFGVAVTRNYKARIIWNQSDNDVTYAGKTANLTIKLTGIQVTQNEGLL